MHAARATTVRYSKVSLDKRQKVLVRVRIYSTGFLFRRTQRSVPCPKKNKEWCTLFAQTWRERIRRGRVAKIYKKDPHDKLKPTQRI
jgi:hypothetical protein